MTSLKAKIFASASANAGLQALLGTSPFRLYDVQLDQGQAGYYPCVTMMIISNPRAYAHGAGRFATSWARVQFTVFGTGNDSQNASAVVEALLSWLDSFNRPGEPPLRSLTLIGDGAVHTVTGSAATRAKWVQVEVPASNAQNALIGGSDVTAPGTCPVTAGVGFPLPPGWFGTMFPPVAELFYSLAQFYYYLAPGDFMYVLYATGQASCPQIGACIVVGDRDGGIAQTQPLTYQRFLDVAIFYKET